MAAHGQFTGGSICRGTARGDGNGCKNNALGIKGIGEVGIVGMNTAVANAVFNAAAVRIRALPIRAEKHL